MKVAVALLAATFVALANASLPTCRCGAFITVNTVEYEVYELPPFEDIDCDTPNACRARCKKEFEKATGDGDLNHDLPNGYTVGQEICIAMSNHHGLHNVRDEPVYSYFNLCDTLWQYDGETSTNNLCCHEGHYHDCDSPPPQN
ncbi:unnamed protein product [Meganyctiphanes norvegica]|uniref:Uncharacterized protein n=1 Tax=Meganyctiphanes norvegica TaxID=48144 RepID=A0AAV2QJ44_MEGNR